MFLSSYTFFNSTVVCRTFDTAVEFDKETKIYTFLKNRASKLNWHYSRIDTDGQIGFPDILLLKKSTYWQIEAKLLKKKSLKNIQDDLRWQFGQLAYMKQALTLGLNYMLVVSKNNTIAFIMQGGLNNDITDYPDFVRLL